MKTTRYVSRTAPAILPLMMLLLPKCPLCLLPLLVAAGLALPPASLLNAVLLVTAVAWLALVTIVTHSTFRRAVALSGAVLFLSGRWLDVSTASWAGVAFMLTVVILGACARPRLRLGSCAETWLHGCPCRAAVLSEQTEALQGKGVANRCEVERRGGSPSMGPFFGAVAESPRVLLRP